MIRRVKRVISGERIHLPQLYSFNSIFVPLNSEFVTVYVKRIAWVHTVNECLKVSLDISLDNGITWISNFVGFGTVGGILKDKDLNILPHSSVTRKLPEPYNPHRRIRVKMKNKYLIRTAISVEFT